MTKRYIPYLAITMIIAIGTVFLFTKRSFTAPRESARTAPMEQASRPLPQQKAIRTDVQTAILGDANRDGVFDGKDPLFLLIFLAEKENERRKLHLGMINPADINEDSKIDVIDVVEMLKRIQSRKISAEQQRVGPVIDKKVVISADEGIDIVYPKQKEIVLAKDAGDEVLHGLFIRGDTNSDGMITIVDAIFILNYLFYNDAQKPKCEDALDVDDNGQINLADAIYLLNFQFAAGPEPKPPFPNPGTDSTEDKLKCPTTP